MAVNQDQARAFVAAMSSDDLVHFGHKGMKWGEHRFGEDHRTGGGGGKPSSADIHAARDRHNARIASIDKHATAIQYAKSSSEKRTHLNEIHKLAKEGLDSNDAHLGSRSTRAEKVGYNVLIGPGLRKQHENMQAINGNAVLDAHRHTKASDYDYYDRT